MNSSFIFKALAHANEIEMNSSSISNDPSLLNDTLNIPLLLTLTMQECLENIENGIIPNIELHSYSKTIYTGEKFNKTIFNCKMHY